MDEGKPCNRCGATKPLTDYYRDRGAKDGRRNTCMACDKERDRRPEVMERKRLYHYTEAGHASERKYAQSEKGKAARAAYEERPERIARKGEMHPIYFKRYYERKGRETAKAYRQRPETRERRRLRQRERYYANIDAMQAYHRAWQHSERARKNREAYTSRPDVKERIRVWSRRYEHIRRARKDALPTTLTDTEWLHALDYFGGRCAYCGGDGPLVQEHVIPVTRGGPYTAGNIVPACAPCNLSKKNRPIERWATPEAYARVITYLVSVLST